MLAPCDFFLSPIIKRTLKGCRFARRSKKVSGIERSAGISISYLMEAILKGIKFFPVIFGTRLVPINSIVIACIETYDNVVRKYNNNTPPYLPHKWK